MMGEEYNNDYIVELPSASPPLIVPNSLETIYEKLLKFDKDNQIFVFSSRLQPFADTIHFIAVIILLTKICKNRSCTGISLYSQILYLIVFLARYLDLATFFYSYYNIVAKILLIILSATIVSLMLFKFKETWEKNYEILHFHHIILPAFILALYKAQIFTFMEIMWTFSIYLESIAILPQLYMIYQKKYIDSTMFWYLFFLGSYRVVYAFRFYQYFQDNYIPVFVRITFNAAVVQSIIYLVFFAYLAIRKIQQKMDRKLPL